MNTDKPTTRRHALKYIGAGTLGTASTLYGINPDIQSGTPPLETTPMKVVLINGSPRRSGNTFTALSEVARTLNENGVQTTIIQLSTRAIQGCTACGKCHEAGLCIFKDELYIKIREELQEADGIVIGSPVYFSGPNGSLCALLDRLFYTSQPLLRHKAGATIAVCRRGGASATIDRLNKYITYSRMQLIGSQYWNIVHGTQPGEAVQDGEGMQIMRTLAHNIAWTIKNKKAGQAPLPEPEPHIRTNFIR